MSATPQDAPLKRTPLYDLHVSLGAKIDSFRYELKGEIQQVLVAVHRTQALMEEQRSENRIVLDGLKNVIERQDRIEGLIT